MNLLNVKGFLKKIIQVSILVLLAACGKQVSKVAVTPTSISLLSTSIPEALITSERINTPIPLTLVPELTITSIIKKVAVTPTSISLLSTSTPEALITSERINTPIPLTLVPELMITPIIKDDTLVVLRGVEHHRDVDIYENKVLGVTFNKQENHEIHEQQYLSDVIGFFVVGKDTSETFPHAPLLLIIGWRYEARAGDLNKVVNDLVNRYPLLNSQIENVEIDGEQGVSIYPMPGEELGTVIIVTANERLYEIGYLGKLDKQAMELIHLIEFTTPTELFDPDKFRD